MDTREIINGCMEIEKSAASIYSNLMELFPKEKEFWKNLFDDEVEHLNFFNDVKSLGLIDELQKIDTPPTMPIINETLKSSGIIIEKIAGRSLSLKDALKMTLKLEETIVEVYTNKLIANLLACDNESSIKKILIGAKLHVDKIKNMMIKKGFLKLS